MNKLFTTILILLFIVQFSWAQSKPVKADPKRLEERIEALAQFGSTPKGGTNRPAFSDADMAARSYIIEQMKKLGLKVRIDAAANIIGYREGKENKPLIAFGSHIDSVPFGGSYDGDVGVISGLEVMELLNEQNIVTDHPLELIVFTDEEGGLTGSQGMVGSLDATDLARVSTSGKTVRQGLTDLGGNPDHLEYAKRSKDEFSAFLEVHIEQGARLQERKLDISVVEGIVSIEWWQVTVQGVANHAGTTPMDHRHDALLAASKVIIAVNEVIRSVEGTQVGTVGRIRAEPGAPNVIPGKVTFSLEIRDLDRDKLFRLEKMIETRAQKIAQESGTTITFKSAELDEFPALASEDIQEKIEESASELGYKYARMPSFAGHDSQEMAKLTRMGMIFVTSKDGISHAPEEYTSPEDMAKGASVLYLTVLKLDKE